MPVYSIGLWAKKLFKFFTMWRFDNVSIDYLNSNCYKIIAQDSADTVIVDGCSAKTGLAQILVEDEYHS